MQKILRLCEYNNDNECKIIKHSNARLSSKYKSDKSRLYRSYASVFDVCFNDYWDANDMLPFSMKIKWCVIRTKKHFGIIRDWFCNM